MNENEKVQGYMFSLLDVLCPLLPPDKQTYITNRSIGKGKKKKNQSTKVKKLLEEILFIGLTVHLYRAVSCEQFMKSDRT